MAHNLEQRDGSAPFFSVKEKAWHVLGTIIENCPDLTAAIELARLGFEVVKQPIFIEGGKVVPDKFATVRTDTGDILGVVGNQYHVVQNKEAFSFFDFLKDEACFETGGVLNNGNIVWLSAKLPAHFSVHGEADKVDQYLFLTTSHDGSKSLQAMFTPVRVVCNNTLNIALRQHSNRISIRHTSNAEAKMKEAHKLMGIVNQLSAEMQTVFSSMAKTKVSDMEVFNLIRMAVSKQNEVGKAEDLSTRTNNIVNNIFTYYQAHTTQQEIKGTVWGAYNAFTGFAQNGEKRTDESKMNALLNGSKLEQRAFDLCLKLVK